MERFRFNVQIKDVEKINNLFSKCKIYICYSDLNRNNSIIPKHVIEENLHTLYNCPILGEFDVKKDDFIDHGGKIEIDDDGEVEYICTTMPFGIVPESSEVAWEFVNGKEYLTCTGYLWSSRYPESLKAIEEGRPQSMELDEVNGEFNAKKNFIVDSFTFSGLCILGKDVEPCFEDAKVTSYSLDKENFTNQFNLMVRELKDSLKHNEVNNGEVNDEVHEFTNTNEKEDDVVIKSKKEIATQFNLTVNQLWDEISRSISEVTYKGIDWWTDEEVDMCRYRMCDFDDSYVYAIDKMMDYIDVKIPYSMNGDNVVVDSENASRIKYVATDWEGASDETEQEEATEELSVNFIKSFVDEVKEKISEKVTEFTQTISEKED
jgi:hypothetical protein